MNYQSITTDGQLHQFCNELSQYEAIAFDSEFVAEHTYRPVLCLIQVAAGGRLAVIDAMALGDMTPFWEAVAEPGHQTVLHAGRGEIEFCLRAIGRPPAGLFDVQIAAGLIGAEYPAAYSTLVSRTLGQTIGAHETRTDWRRRPLSKRQIEYALNDAQFLLPLRDELQATLNRLNRLDWMAEEMEAWQGGIQRALSEDRWQRTSGNSGLDCRGMAIVRELWKWREGEAERRNTPVRRVLRDDLIVELARRRSADLQRIQMVRGLERGDLRRRLGEMAASIQRALDLPQSECPPTVRRERTPQHSVLGQFLFSALGSVCRQARLAPSLVGNPGDIRQWIDFRTARDNGDRRCDAVPKLARGWRAEFIGRLFDDLLAGKKAIHIENPASESPLVFEPRPA
ncbi:MAG: HRDC domain-containing protein [Pirellulales bacterium]|nr:HRDC domain-containing protein [Pirellulales bacterium]